jgi:hypothetical protein
MGPNSAMEADSTAPYIAAYRSESGQILIIYKPTENSHILHTQKNKIIYNNDHKNLNPKQTVM